MKDIAITESLRVGRTPRKIIITFFGYPKSMVCNITRDILQSNPRKVPWQGRNNENSGTYRKEPKNSFWKIQGLLLENWRLF